MQVRINKYNPRRPKLPHIFAEVEFHHCSYNLGIIIIILGTNQPTPLPQYLSIYNESHNVPLVQIKP